jgi:hypothetical protein
MFVRGRGGVEGDRAENWGWTWTVVRGRKKLERRVGEFGRKRLKAES